MSGGSWQPGAPTTLDGRFALDAATGLVSHGATYEGRDLETGEAIHVTVLHPALFAEGRRALNLKKLTRMLGARHPNLAPVLHVAAGDEHTYVVTGPRLGQSVARWRREAGGIGIDEAYRLMAQLLDALEVVHQHGVHGALSPDTVRITGGQLWVTQPWHLERPAALERGELPPVRTAWLAPEQLYDVAPEGPETDVYAAGLLLGFLLACGLTEPGHSLMIQGLDIPPAVDEVYVRATARQSELRFHTVAAFREALEKGAGPEWSAALPLAVRAAAQRIPSAPIIEVVTEAVIMPPPGPFPAEPTDPELETVVDALMAPVMGPPPMPVEATPAGLETIRDGEPVGPQSEPPPVHDTLESVAVPAVIEAAVAPPPVETASAAGPPDPGAVLTAGSGLRALGASARVFPGEEEPQVGWTIDARALSEAVRTGQSLDGLVSGQRPSLATPTGPPDTALNPSPAREPRSEPTPMPAAVRMSSGLVAPSKRSRRGLLWLAAAVFLLAGGGIAVAMLSDGGAPRGGDVVASASFANGEAGGVIKRPGVSAAEGVAPRETGQGVAHVVADTLGGDTSLTGAAVDTTGGVDTTAVLAGEAADAGVVAADGVANAMVRGERLAEQGGAVADAETTDRAAAPPTAKPLSATYTPVDWKALKCPAGMAKIRKKTTVKLADGSKATDFLVHCIDKYEYPGAGSIPKTRVSLAEAKAACESHGKHLCSKTEWRRGCGYRYPYAGDYDASRCNTVGDDYAPKALVASGAKRECRSGWGTYDMVGNAAEWTSDGSVNGGGANKNGDDATCTKSSRRVGGHPYVGFRCCAKAE